MTTPHPADTARLPPHDMDAEMGFLAAILTDLPAAIAYAGTFDPEDFYYLRAVAHAVRAVHAKGHTPDPVTVKAELVRRGTWEQSAENVCTLGGLVINPSNAPAYLATIQEKAVARRAFQVMREGVEQIRGGEPAEQVIARITANLATVKPVAAEVPAYQWRGIEAMLAEASPALEPLWPGVVWKGALTLIAAPPKVGKTWMLFAWAATLTTGASWLGHHGTGRPVKVLLVSEEPAFIIKAQAARFGVDTGMDVLTMDAAPPGATWPDTVNAAMARAVEVQAEAVIFDTVSTLAGMEDENSAADVNRALRPLLLAARAHDVAVVAVHHSGANGRIRGSTVFEAVPDVLVEVDRHGGDGSRLRKIKVRGRLEGAPEHPITVEYHAPTDTHPACYSPTHASRTDVAAERERARLSALDQSIVAALSNHREDGDPAGWLSRAALSELVPARDLKVRLPELVRAGRIQRTIKPGRAGTYLYAAPGVPLPTLDAGAENPTLSGDEAVPTSNPHKSAVCGDLGVHAGANDRKASADAGTTLSDGGAELTGKRGNALESA